MTKKELLVLLLILVAISTRFLFIVDGMSILPNFTAVGAIAIFGACHFKGTKRWIIPLFVLWLSDLVLNNIVYAQYYDHFQIFGSLWVYGSIALIGIVAYFIMRQATWTRLALTGLAGAVVFFLITNFGSWLSATSPYTKDVSGLMASYTAGIPFFRNTLLGNVVFSFALFGCYEYLAARIPNVESTFSKGTLMRS